MLFQPGQSGNPSGRPRGALNKNNAAKQAREQLIEEIWGDSVETILYKVLDRALNGDFDAQKLILERTCPKPRGRKVSMVFPAVQGPDDLLSVVNSLLTAISTQQLTFEEVGGFLRGLSHATNVLEAGGIENRVALLESKLAL